ncbi:MAG: hypothetical protein ACE14T_01040 [Syntrophales bacterium]
MFEKFYHRVEVRTYANLKREKFIKILESLRVIRADYIIAADIDTEPCVTAKKQYVRMKLQDIETDKVQVVIKEIESWYLAGLDDSSQKEMGLPFLKATDDITKEKFIELVPEKFDSRIDFMMEILKYFSPVVARSKNHSFDYFMAKYRLPAG